MDIDLNQLETKAGIPAEAADSADAVVTHAEMMRAFESFKEANDERIDAIAKRGGDVVLEEKVARINSVIELHQRFIDDAKVKAARPALGDVETRSTGEHEYKSAFDAFIRQGDSSGLRQLETKALSAGSNPDGGFVVPPEIETQIGQRLIAVSPIRSISSVRTISSIVYKKPMMTTGPAVGWVGETDARTQTASPVLDELSFPAMELYAMPAATSTLLEDAAVNIGEWLAGEVELVFAVQEGAAFIAGDGNNKPKGFLSYTTVPNASWSWGNIGYVASGSPGAFPSSNPSDALIDLIYALAPGYRQNGIFVMNRKTQSVIRKFKDSTGNYLWQPPATAGARANLLGFPALDAEDMPDIAAGSLSIAFGDFSRGYLIVDRAGISVLRDPYTAKPYVLFYTTKRVGGGVQDFDAIKVMKFAAS